MTIKPKLLQSRSCNFRSKISLPCTELYLSRVMNSMYSTPFLRMKLILSMRKFMSVRSYSSERDGLGICTPWSRERLTNAAMKRLESQTWYYSAKKICDTFLEHRRKKKDDSPNIITYFSLDFPKSFHNHVKNRRLTLQIVGLQHCET